MAVLIPRKRVNTDDLSTWYQPEPQNWWLTADEALAEDLGSGDVTAGCIAEDRLVRWQIEIQAEGVLAGVGIAEYLLAPEPDDPDRAEITVHRNDGAAVARGDVVISGLLTARKALACERTALNFLMRLSGIATLTRQFVQKIEGTQTRIVDTRKTTPLLRSLEKYAVRCGGGHNHRMGLYDGAMVKDNHIAAAGSITAAVEAIRSYASHMIKIEVECENLDQVDEAVASRADVILLDNMDPFMMREAVKRHQGKVLFEASGGVALDTVRTIAMTGVDLISVGALTHSAPALAMHMEFA
ncbi:MAG: carboxylating nicotinate-nucleotide diphosphorylase [Fimbriimonas sp.]